MYDSRYAFHKKSRGDLKERVGREYCKRTGIGRDKQVKDSLFDVAENCYKPFLIRMNSYHLFLVCVLGVLIY